MDSDYAIRTWAKLNEPQTAYRLGVDGKFFRQQKPKSENLKRQTTEQIAGQPCNSCIAEISKPPAIQLPNTYLLDLVGSCDHPSSTG